MNQYLIEYGDKYLPFNSPLELDVKGMSVASPLKNPARDIRDALKNPIESMGLTDIAKEKKNKNSDAKAIIVVSDNTRPVPYRGPDGIMIPILEAIYEGGFERSEIIILIGAGSHRNMDEKEIEEMLGLNEFGWGNVSVINHEYDNKSELVFLGNTQRGSRAWINKLYLETDLKIVTGLVESHFMAGASGGRKGICPGIVGKETLEIFHGANLLNSAHAADMILEGNPLSEESTEVALMAGCDFLVNTTLDADKKLTGIYAGDMLEAHRAAVSRIREYVVIPLEKPADIVLIPAGFVGLNHYQAAKAAVEASRAVKKGGQIILLAKHTDKDLIGGKGYKDSLALLKDLGPEKLLEKMLSDDWILIQEQWQVQMWCKVLNQIERNEYLIYCNLDIPDENHNILPGIQGVNLLEDEDIGLNEEDKMIKILDRALDLAIRRSNTKRPDILFLKDGPYGIPEVKD